MVIGQRSSLTGMLYEYDALPAVCFYYYPNLKDAPVCHIYVKQNCQTKLF